jgi:hypothetical protein
MKVFTFGSAILGLLWVGHDLVSIKIWAQWMKIFMEQVHILKTICIKGWLKIILSMLQQVILEGEEQICNYIITTLPNIWIIHAWTPILWKWHPLCLRATLDVINGVSIKFEKTKIPSMSPSLYESLYRFINHIEGYIHMIINLTENDHLFVFVCKRSRGMYVFN